VINTNRTQTLSMSSIDVYQATINTLCGNTYYCLHSCHISYVPKHILNPAAHVKSNRHIVRLITFPMIQCLTNVSVPIYVFKHSCLFEDICNRCNSYESSTYTFSCLLSSWMSEVDSFFKV